MEVRDAAVDMLELLVTTTMLPRLARKLAAKLADYIPEKTKEHKALSDAILLSGKAGEPKHREAVLLLSKEREQYLRFLQAVLQAQEHIGKQIGRLTHIYDEVPEHM